jgi:hypothetical protein
MYPSKGLHTIKRPSKGLHTIKRPSKGLQVRRTDPLREADHAKVALAPGDVEEPMGAIGGEGRGEAADVREQQVR